MAIYRGHTITNRGRQLLAKVMAGQGEFEVSAVKFGSGRFEGNQREVTDLVNEKISLELINIRNEGAMAVVTARLTNENLLESFRAEELGIFAKLKGTNEEVLYAYTLALESDVIPDNSLGATLIIDLNIYMELSDSVDAVMTINESRVFLTLEHAKEIFSQTGLLYSGELLNMGSLQENKVYKANDGKYYKNIGGNRVWNGTGEIDDKFKEVTWERLNQDILALAIEDGKNMAKILGVEDYGGILNTSDLKKAGWAYYCTQNKYIYECLSDTRLNYADAEFFEPLSNKSLLGKLQNLDDGINSFRQFDTVFYKGISIDIVYNDSLMWFSFEGNPS
ncbi:hypothetical protein HS141_11090, partial [Cetobacterium somerae]|uniref:hypothetical protein n=1 Tax=Cetobacterium somerae TaxID=188913 RepID=UPI00211E2916